MINQSERFSSLESNSKVFKNKSLYFHYPTSNQDMDEVKLNVSAVKFAYYYFIS